MATSVIAIITLPVNASVAALLDGTQAAAGPIMYAMSVGTTNRIAPTTTTAYTQRFHAMTKPAASPKPALAH